MLAIGLGRDGDLPVPAQPVGDDYTKYNHPGRVGGDAGHDVYVRV